MTRSHRTLIQRTVLPALAVVSILGAAGTASADSLPVTMSMSSWSDKSTSVGSFGAGFGAGFTVQTSSGSLVGTASGDASLELFGAKVSIVDLSADVSLNAYGASTASATAEVVGATVYDGDFSTSSVFDLSDVDNYDDLFCIDFFDVSTTFTVVVVPITMAAGAQGCATLTIDAEPTYDTSTHVAALNTTITPGVNADLTASVGAGTSAFSAGVEADVTLINCTLPVILNPSYNFQSGSASVVTSGQVALTDMLGGSAKVYAKADLGLWDVEYSKKLFSWKGISKSWYLWSNGKPTAASPRATIDGGTATGTYDYTDTASTAEGSSQYVWYRNTTASDTGRTPIGSSNSKTHTIVQDDNGAYLQFCVTPYNAANPAKYGDQVCSDWASVGKIASFYSDNNYGGTNLALAYQNSTSGTCYNLDDYISSYDNVASSYKLYAPSDSYAKFYFYKGYDCADTASSETTNKTVSAGGSNQQTSTSDLGSSWNDRLTSVMVVYGEDVTAEDVTISISGETASSAYAFNVADSTNTTESGSTYVWYRSSTASDTGRSTISGATSKTYTLTADDDQKYLKLCVTPSNGYTTGDQACSDWAAVGHLLKLYKDANYSGTTHAFAWEKSARETCFNLSDYSFNDAMTAFAWANNSVSSSTVWFYKDANCSGSSFTRTLSASGSESVSSVGSTWNDEVSAFKVSWNSAVDITNPVITISGNTATESHTYNGGGGLPESATWTWYRSSSSSGDKTSGTQVTNALSNSYTLTSSDEGKYLKACVLSGNGVMVDEYEVCSSWTSVGKMMMLFTDLSYSSTSVNIAYQKTASGTCFNLGAMGFDDVTSSYIWHAPSFGTAKFSMYPYADCAGGTVTYGNVSANQTALGFFDGTADNTVSSVKVEY
ncbi:MAG: hypothetical protein U0441_22790 [Polyangiaceae bacterium]